MNLKSIVALSLGVSACVPRGKPELTISPIVKSSFQWGYSTVTERAGLENGWCLYGNRRGTRVTVNRVEYPVVAEATEHSILFGCRPAKDYLGKAHSHNVRFGYNLPCRPSPLDVTGFNKESKSVIMGVICGDEMNFIYKRK